MTDARVRNPAPPEQSTKKGPETFGVLRTNGGNRGCVCSLYAKIAPDARLFILSNNQSTPFSHQSPIFKVYLFIHLINMRTYIIKIV